MRFNVEDLSGYPGMQDFVDEHERLHHEKDVFRVCAGWAYEDRHDGNWDAAFDPKSLEDGVPTVVGRCPDPAVPDFLYEVSIFEEDEDGELFGVGRVEGVMTDDPTDGEVVKSCDA